MRITPTALDSKVSVMQAAEDAGEVLVGFVVEEKAEDPVDSGLKKQQVTGKQGSDDFGSSQQWFGTNPRGGDPTPVSSSPTNCE